jgi:hypothetical protein
VVLAIDVKILQPGQTTEKGPSFTVLGFMAVVAHCRDI